MKDWKSIKMGTPEPGIEVLLFNENWKHPDWNPRGIRIGFLDDVSGWVSAYWCNTHDEYHTRDSMLDDEQFEDSSAMNQIPSHWKEITL